MVSLSQHIEKVRGEHDNLQDLSWQQQLERQQLTRELKVATDTSALEEGIRRNLLVETEATKIIMEVDKEVLIQKQLQVLYKGEAQPFPRLYTSMQDFSNEIMQVQEGLEREFKAIRQYLEEKHRPKREASQKEDEKVEGKKDVIVVHCSESEGEWPAGVQILGMAKRALADQPESSQHVVPFQPLEEKHKLATGKAEDYIPLPDQLAQEKQPMVEQIHQTCLTKYPDTLPPGPMTMVTGSPAFWAVPTASKPPVPPSPPQEPQNDQPAS
jgi:DNA repair exonuclease SbcCD nuclease subunit